MTAFTSYLIYLRDKGGPAVADYAEFESHCRVFMDAIDAGRIHTDGQAESFDVIGEAGTSKTILGHTFRGPRGYKGDFETIERIYQNFLSPDPHLTRWDQWVQSMPAAQAVRNRRSVFKRLVADLSSPSRILSLGCGPCRDILDALETGGGHRYVCIDIDGDALAFARKVLSDHLPYVSLQKQNALRFQTDVQFQLVWSAGLFDYLSDDLFRLLLRRSARCLQPDGKLVIGNFSPVNPNQASMNWSEWRLIHRNESQLIELGNRALPEFRWTVFSESTGVNLFLSGVMK